MTLKVERIWPPDREPTEVDALAFALWEANFDSALSQRMMSVHGEWTDGSYQEAAEMIFDSLPPGFHVRVERQADEPETSSSSDLEAT